jgi:hypothetical protein
LTLDVKKSNSSNETPNVMTVGVEKYGLSMHNTTPVISDRGKAVLQIQVYTIYTIYILIL